MLFKILKLFGFDVPGRMEAVTANLEGRVERVIDRLKELAQEAVLLAILGVAALVTALMAAAAGLIAVYRLSAETYGDYAGLGVVAGILIVLTLILVALMIATVRRLEAAQVTTISPGRVAEASEAHRLAEENDTIPTAPAATSAAPATTFNEGVPSVEAVASPLASPASAGDLIEPLTYILSDVIRIPTFGNTYVDEFVDKLRGAARSNAEDTVQRAASVVRFGRRLDLLFVLGGTAAIAWLVTRNAQPRH
jgi:uncharacterized membrane protein